jgi:IclR family acetate operon transcriptional repressor
MERSSKWKNLSMRPVLISLQILEEVASRQPIGTSELARHLELSKTTVHRALMSLAEAGWIESSGEARKSWQLSIHALVVAGRAVESGFPLRSIALPVMEGLRRTTEETIHLVTRYRDSVALIERLDGIKPVRVFHPFGGRAPLHATSSGKAMLANLPQAELDLYLRDRLSDGAAGSPTKLQALVKELQLVRRRGFAVNLGQNLPDANAVGAAIMGEGDQPIAAITISAPSERMPEKLCLARGELVSDAARRIALGLRVPR